MAKKIPADRFLFALISAYRTLAILLSKRGIERSRRPIADIEGSFAIWYAKSSMATCSSATWERYHAARRWVLLRCCAVCCGG